MNNKSKLFAAAIISTVDDVGAALIPPNELTEELKAVIDNCKFEYELHEDTQSYLIFNPKHPNFSK